MSKGNLIKSNKRKNFLNNDSSGSDDELSQQNKPVQKPSVRTSQRRLSTPPERNVALKELKEKRATSKAPKRFSLSCVDFGNSPELKGRSLLSGEENNSVGGCDEFTHNTNESGTLPSDFHLVSNYKSGDKMKKKRAVCSSGDSDSDGDIALNKPAPTPSTHNYRLRLRVQKSPALKKLEAKLEARKRLDVNGTSFSHSPSIDETGELLSQSHPFVSDNSGNDIKVKKIISISSDSGSEDMSHFTSSTDDLSDFIDDSDVTGTSTSSSNSSTSGISGDKPLELEFNIFIQYLMSLALDPTFKENKGTPNFEEVIKIENKLLDSQRLVKSQAWSTWFRTALETFPHLSFDNSASEGGNCEACKKPKRVASTVLRFSGRKYDWEKIECGEEENEEEKDQEMQTFDVGCYCMRRAHLYHDLYHLKYKLYQQCKSVISSFDDGKEASLILNECLDDKFWVSKRYDKFHTLINNATKLYTEDGRGQKPSSYYY